jgi:hypothetical protein
MILSVQWKETRGDRYFAAASIPRPLDDWLHAFYNFARCLKTLPGLTPYEYLCKVWTSEAQRFNVDPTCVRLRD